jgi:SAM-dependent methyltransferase
LIPRGGQVVDLACGKGRHVRFLLNAGYSVLALDNDLSGINDIAGELNLEVFAADLENHGVFPLQGRQFSGIVVVNYLFRPLFADLMNILSSGGVLIYQTFMLGNEVFGRPNNPAFLLKENELLDTFGGKLDVVAFEQGYIEKPNPAFVQKICAIKR